MRARDLRQRLNDQIETMAIAQREQGAPFEIRKGHITRLLSQWIVRRSTDPQIFLKQEFVIDVRMVFNR